MSIALLANSFLELYSFGFYQITTYNLLLALSVPVSCQFGKSELRNMNEFYVMRHTRICGDGVVHSEAQGQFYH